MNLMPEVVRVEMTANGTTRVYVGVLEEYNVEKDTHEIVSADGQKRFIPYNTRMMLRLTGVQEEYEFESADE